MARFELLVGSQVFWRRARADLAAARSRVLVQAMTFEGDRAGLAIAEAIARSPATDRRVLIDDFSRHKISDHMIHLPQNLLDSDLRDERRATMEMFARLQASGARLRITNPIGLKPWRFPVRNHKKLLVIDSVAYVGGLNFSDHNFAWDDLMVRIEGAGLAGFVAADFERTWASEPAFAHAAFDGAEVFALDGRTNTERFGVLLSRLDRAGERIVVISPYLTSPFTDALADASARGVGVTVFSPWDNNKRIVRDALAAAARRTTIDLRLTSGMSHMKALLIDDRRLVELRFCQLSLSGRDRPRRHRPGSRRDVPRHGIDAS